MDRRGVGAKVARQRDAKGHWRDHWRLLITQSATTDANWREKAPE